MRRVYSFFTISVCCLIIFLLSSSLVFAGVTERVSISSIWEEGNDSSVFPSISADGRYVVFASLSSNLVPGDTNGCADIFVRDRFILASGKLLQDAEPIIASAYSVTAVFSDCFYIESADRSFGIKVLWSSPVTEGTRVRVDGTMTTDAGERCIQATNVRMLDNLATAPLAIPLRFLGGSSFGFTPGSDESGQLGVKDGVGLNNIGLLVRVWGRVTQVGDDYLYIDDGSNLKDGTYTGEDENTGVRVICDPSDYKPGDYLIVTGISSCFVDGDNLCRRILTRRAEDISKISKP